MRLNTQFRVRFYGFVKDEYRDGKKIRSWQEGKEVVAVAYDTIVPGFNIFKTVQASNITSVLYPNDNSVEGKELRLKQEYFFSSASIQNIVNEFKKLNLNWDDFPKFNCIQLNDTHPSIALVELLRILIDEQNIDYHRAFDIVRRTFNYTNHTILPEALEKWGVDLFGRLLPRHLELIYLINFFFMEEIKKNIQKIIIE